MSLVFKDCLCITRCISVIISLVALVPGAAFAANWPTYHGDNTRSGVDAAENSVTAVNQAWQSVVLDGKVYASPVTLGSQVIVATENNSVYSFDQASGALNWRHQVAPPYLGGLPCGNLGPPMGITSTPVIDTATGYVYVVALVGGPDYALYALNANAGGAEVFHVNVNPGGPDFSASYQGQRPALALANGYVYIGYGGRDGDCGTYHGWLVGARADGTPGLISWHTQVADASHPGANEGGLWGASGPAVDGAGNILVATGNGVCSSTAYDDTNSVVKLSPALVKIDYWAPSNWHALSCSDTDIGSLGPVILGDGRIFQSGKASVSYLIDPASMGGVAGSADGHPFQMSNCSGAFGGAAAYGGLVFVPCPFSNSIVALNAGTTQSEAWHETIAGGMPIVAGGYVWAIGGGALHGFNYLNGNALFSLPVEGHSTSFPALAAANGKIFYAGNTHLTAFQLAETLTGHGPGNPDTGRPWTGGSDAVGLTAGGTDAYFAEGYTGDNFHEYVTVGNLSGSVQTLTVDYLLSGGAAPVSTSYPLPAVGRLTIDVNHDIGSGQDVSVHLHAPGRFVAERPMYFNSAGRTGGHVAMGAQALAQRFYFAEGHTGDGVDEYLTFMNTNAGVATATVTFFLPGGPAAPFQLGLPGHSRVTIHVNDYFPHQDVSTKVDVDLPILVERPMYFNVGGITGGHVAVGATSLGTDLSLAEGHTGDGFTEYVTVANPNLVPANIAIYYYLPNGQVVPAAFQVGAQARLTVLVNGTLPHSDQSLRVTSDQPITAERPMYFVYGGVWDGGHDAVAVPTANLASTYYFAEGYAAANFEEYLTVLNRNAAAVTVHIVFTDQNGVAYPADLLVGANSRGTFRAKTVVPYNTPVTATVTAPVGVPILVERAMYFAY